MTKENLIWLKSSNCIHCEESSDLKKGQDSKGVLVLFNLGFNVDITKTSIRFNRYFTMEDYNVVICSDEQEEMKPVTADRRNAIIIGIFFIAAAVTSVIALILFDPVLSDEWYLAATHGFEAKILFGVFNELLLIVTAVGTAVMLFPYLRRWNEQIALGHLCFRFMETVFIAIGVVSILSLLQLSMHYEANELVNNENLLGLGYIMQSVHRWTFMLGPNFMLGMNTLLYSYLLFKTGLVPRPLALFGMITAIMVFAAGLLDMFGWVEPLSTLKGLIALPVGVYEISLAVWLIVKGFHKQNLERLMAK